MMHPRIVETDEPVPVGGAVAAGVVAVLDIPLWTEHLHSLPGWMDGDRASTLLVRQPPVRVLLSALRQGGYLGSDGAEETLMIHVLLGAVSLEWAGDVARVKQGEMALVPAGGGWSIRAEADETRLLTTFWGTTGDGIADHSRDAAAAR